MQPGISTHVFLPQRLHPGLLDALHKSGAQTIELFAARHHFDYTDRAAVRDIATWFRNTGVGATLHQPLYISDRADAQWSRHVAPNLNLIDPEKSRRISAMDEVKRALESAEQIPITFCTLHLGHKTPGTPAPSRTPSPPSSTSKPLHTPSASASCSKISRTRSPRPSTFSKSS